MMNNAIANNRSTESNGYKRTQTLGFCNPFNDDMRSTLRLLCGFQNSQAANKGSAVNAQR
jgi:hypothetical protein